LRVPFAPSESGRKKATGDRSRSWLRNQEIRPFGEASSRYRLGPATPVVRACFRVSTRISKAHMACAFPFRPWSCLAPRVFKTRTARAMSTDPERVPSCTFTPPQWLAPNRVASHGKLGRPCLRCQAPRFSLGPFSISKRRRPFSHRDFSRRLKSFAVLSRSPALRVWLPSRRCQQPLPSGASFNSPRSWALLFRAYFQPRDADLVSHAWSAPTLSCQTLRPGSGAPAASVRRAS
jgi:hypothetical protein